MTISAGSPWHECVKTFSDLKCFNQQKHLRPFTIQPQIPLILKALEEMQNISNSSLTHPSICIAAALS